MKKIILKVWMILAISFLAMDVVGQTYTTGYPNVNGVGQETATLNVSATVGGGTTRNPTHYTLFVVLNSSDPIPTIQNVIDWSLDGGGVVPSGRYGEIGLASPDTEFSYGVSNLLAGTGYVAYFVTVESDFVTVVIETDSPTARSFTTLAAPAPLTATLNPLDNALGISINTSSYVMTFSEAIAYNTTGTYLIRLYETGITTALVTKTIENGVADAGLSIDALNNTLSIDFGHQLEYSKEYYITIYPDAIISLNTGVSYAGLIAGEWSFTTEAEPITAVPPAIIPGTRLPVPGATEVSRAPTIEVQFDRQIQWGVDGIFRLRRKSDDVTASTISPSETGTTISNDLLSIVFSSPTLDYGTEYYVEITNDFVRSVDGAVSFPGVTKIDNWSFTTESSPPIWADGYPSISNQTMTDFVFNAWADLTGTYFGVVTQSSTVPTAEQISQGLNHGGTAARIDFNDIVSDNSVASTQTVLFNSDTPLGSPYYLHAVYRNGTKYSEVRTFTIDRIVPQILSSNPSNGLIVFEVGSPLSISFNEPVVGSDGNALTTAYFSLVKNVDPAETVTVGFSVETVSEITTVTLIPTLPLDANALYVLTISPVYDLNGNISSEIIINFETDGVSTWTGGGNSSDWTDPNNWGGAEYIQYKSVTIPNGLSQYPAIGSGTVDVHHLTIDPGAVLTHTGGSLNVTGMFKLKSSVDVNASYVNNGAEGTTLNVVGSNVSVEQIISNIDLTYLIASPTKGSSAANFGNYFPLYTYNNTTDSWDAISFGALMVPGVGYRMWTDDGLVDFSGDINTDTTTVNLTRTDGQGYGWNLVGNPYPASIDWTLLGITEASTIENAFWMWMPTQRAYGAYSASTDIPINIESSKIPSNHAFLVKVKIGEPTGSIEFLPGAQVANDANYLKSGSTKPVVDYIKLAGVTSNNVKDEMAVAFIDEASTGFDRFDLEKRFANRDHLFELFSLAESMKTSINAIPLNGSYEVPLGFNALKTGDFAIEMVTNNAENVETILVDNSNGTEIRLFPGERYNFSVGAKGLNTSRFALKFLKVSTDFDSGSGISNRSSVHVEDREVFVNIPTDFVGSEYRVHDFSGRLIRTGVMGSDGLNSLGHLIVGSYIINILSTSSSTLENHKVVVY